VLRLAITPRVLGEAGCSVAIGAAHCMYLPAELVYQQDARVNSPLTAPELWDRTMITRRESYNNSVSIRFLRTTDKLGALCGAVLSTLFFRKVRRTASTHRSSSICQNIVFPLQTILDRAFTLKTEAIRMLTVLHSPLYAPSPSAHPTSSGPTDRASHPP
jgi:hypothetical protein